MRVHFEVMHTNAMRDIHLADPWRPIDGEFLRAGVTTLASVGSCVWIDHSKMLGLDDGGQCRSMDNIPRLCAALVPLGDMLRAVVNVQDLFSKKSEGAGTLSRNVQLASEGWVDFASPLSKSFGSAHGPLYWPCAS